jgi:hypothetical protein
MLTVMKYLVTSVLICGSLSGLMAQNSQSTSFVDNAEVLYSSRIETNANGDTVLISELKTRSKNQQEFVKVHKGTPFFKNKWFNGKMRLKNGEVIKGNMAFDLVNNVVQFSPFRIDEATEVRPEEIILDDHILKRQDDTFKNAMNYYYEVVHNEKSLILSRPVCRYRPKTYAPKTGYEPEGDDIEGYFEKSESLFLASGDKLILIRSNWKFYEMFSDHKQDILNYVSNNKLNIKSKSDILRIIRYYDSLI